jgi:hypothetical protein
LSIRQKNKKANSRHLNPLLPPLHLPHHRQFLVGLMANLFLCAQLARAFYLSFLWTLKLFGA